MSFIKKYFSLPAQFLLSIILFGKKGRRFDGIFTNVLYKTYNTFYCDYLEEKLRFFKLFKKFHFHLTILSCRGYTFGVP
jgi:hypothetical protein